MVVGFHYCQYPGLPSLVVSVGGTCIALIPGIQPDTIPPLPPLTASLPGRRGRRRIGSDLALAASQGPSIAAYLDIRAPVTITSRLAQGDILKPTPAR